MGKPLRLRAGDAVRSLIVRFLVPPLRRLGLLVPAFRLYERWVAPPLRRRGGRDEIEAAPDGLPIPPGRLIALVAGHGNPRNFLKSGARSAEVVRGAVERAGASVESLERLLDFGCGCGRVTRHWAGLERTEVHATDLNPELVRWCAQNLPFVQARVNGLEPPLSYEDRFFDLVYSQSVMTHLSLPLADRWIAELRRVLRPGGLLVFTVNGSGHLDGLSAAERATYDAGDPVVRYAEADGSNLCVAFHPPEYVTGSLLRELECLEYVPSGGRGNTGQDLYVARRPDDEA